MNHQEQLQFYADEVNQFLDALTADQDGKVGEAVRYSLLGGGKRIRPVLLLVTCDMLGGNIGEALYSASALEMVHTYSLIHDDLPCMDDDDYRRGRPSCHKRFGEATALLAGDALLTEAFSVLTMQKNSATVKKTVALLSKAAGNSGMIHGQELDLLAEKDSSLLKEINENKTGKLILASVMMGAACSGLDDPEKEDALKDYAVRIGEVFQVVDDILDVTSTQEVLGKPVGSDKKNDKTTFVSMYGLDYSREYAIKLTQEACDALSVFGEKADLLKWYAEQLLVRIK